MPEDVQPSYLCQRYVYTHSDYSSGLSSLSTVSQQSNRVCEPLYRGVSNWQHSEPSLFQRARSRVQQMLAYTKLPAFLNVLSLFLIISVSAGVPYIHGIFEQDYSRTFARNAGGDRLNGAHISSAIGACQLAFYMASRCLSSVLAGYIGSYPAVLVGAALSGGGFFAASYSTKVWQLCLTQGMLVGVGSAISSQAAIQMARAKYRSYHQFPTVHEAICLAGSGIGGSALSLGTRKLATENGTSIALRWLSLVVVADQAAAILLHLMAASAATASACGDGFGVTSEMVLLGRESDAVKQDPAVATGCVSPQDNSSVDSAMLLNKPGRAEGLLEWALYIRRRIVRVFGTLCFNMASIAPLVFIPGFASTKFEDGQQMVGASLVSLVCLWLAVGSVLAQQILSSSYMRPALLQGTSYAMLSLSIWCLWLPATTARGLVYAFCITYGVFLGMACVLGPGDPCCCAAGESVSAISLAAMAAGCLGTLGSVMLSILACSWLLTSAGDGTNYIPLIVLAAALSSVAAIACLFEGVTS